MRDHRTGPLEGFRSKAGWPFVAELALVADAEAPGRFKLEFDFGEDAKAEQSGEAVDLSAEVSFAPCPKCGAAVKAFGKSYICEKSVPSATHAPSCDFKSGQIVLQQAIAPEQMQKLLSEGKTDPLTQFISNRTRRPFTARLAWSADEGKVIFEFEPREGARKYPPRATAGKAAGAGASGTSAGGRSKAAAASKPAAKKAAASKTAKAVKAPRAGSLQPSAALAAIIGPGTFGRGEVMKKLWDYIKAHNLQDPQDKRTIVADDKLRPVLGADRVGMFKLAGIVSGHLQRALALPAPLCRTQNAQKLRQNCRRFWQG